MTRRLIVLPSLALIIAPFMTGTAQAVSSCVWDSGNATLTIASDSEAVETLVVSGTAINYDGAACDGGATTATVDDIVISGTELSELTVDLSGGAFAPGAEVEATGTSEIEFTVSTLATLFISGTTGNDVFALGSNGINLNDDDDVDVTVSDVAFVSLLGLDGEDTFDAAGDAVVGTGFTGGLFAFGGPGNDSIAGGPTGDGLEGDLGADALDGGGGGDIMGGGEGADSLNGGPGADDLFGGAGHDFADYSDAASGVTVSLAGGASGGAGNDELDGFESVTGSSFADTLIGNDLPNNLEGLGGNDTLNGRGGFDALYGGIGRDRASFAGSPKKVVVHLGSGDASGWGQDLLSSLEDATGSSHADFLAGSASANRISAGRGDDRIRGASGPDDLSGQGGKDRIQPGPGGDQAVGGSGRDTIDLSTATRSVTINLSKGRTAGDGADSIPGFESAVGSRFADSIVGNGKGNTLKGGRGDDKIGGLDGADRLLGAAGQDKLNGGDGPDILQGAAAHDVLNGNSGDDRLSGGDGPDLLYGDAGNDALNGGPGTDTCHQDAGSGPKTSCEKPAPPPSGGGGGGGGGGCTPGYSPCLPLGPSDYDCSGGDGNGPAYTQPGVVYRVTGSDPYGLDADNDGFGCE
jgi:Ca2+-binding RTX toxin-like protein